MIDWVDVGFVLVIGFSIINNWIAGKRMDALSSWIHSADGRVNSLYGRVTVLEELIKKSERGKGL